uniref:SFRICE_005492 n=1 Tax=Spodoptera frugiperda TaxID=7108 RepID=A0A2H1VZE8_SPOFR
MNVLLVLGAFTNIQIRFVDHTMSGSLRESNPLHIAWLPVAQPPRQPCNPYKIATIILLYHCNLPIQTIKIYFTHNMSGENIWRTYRSFISIEPWDLVHPSVYYRQTVSDPQPVGREPANGSQHYTRRYDTD